MRHAVIFGALAVAVLAQPLACGDDATTCGNWTCDMGETSTSCPGDCSPGCGDGACSGETCGSCPTDCGECPDVYCGDSFCNGTETCSTCEMDCGACPCTSMLCTSGSALCCPGGNPGTWNGAIAHCDCYTCTTADDCGVSDICISGRCESAWGRSYRITAVSATLRVGIDSDDSVPDPYITVVVDGTAHQSAYVDENYAPTWNYSFDATLRSASTFTWTIYDYDWVDDDPLWSRPSGTSVDVGWLRAGTTTFYSDSGLSSVTFTFAPR